VLEKMNRPLVVLGSNRGATADSIALERSITRTIAQSITTAARKVGIAAFLGNSSMDSAADFEFRFFTVQ
jgi:hypothetical protein